MDEISSIDAPWRSFVNSIPNAEVWCRRGNQMCKRINWFHCIEVCTNYPWCRGCTSKKCDKKELRYQD